MLNHDSCTGLLITFPNLRMGVVAAGSVLYALMPPLLATAQEASMSTTVASLGSGTATSLINLDAVKPKPAADRGLALPSLVLTNTYRGGAQFLFGQAFEARLQRRLNLGW